MSVRRYLVLLPVFWGLSPAASGQSVIVVDDVTPGEAYQIVFEASVNLAGDEPAGGGVLGAPRAFSTDPLGRFLSSTWRMGSEIRRFHPNGKYDQSFGGLGEGPGEYTAVSVIRTGPGDSIWAFELFGRVTVLDSEMEYARSFPFNHQLHAAVPLPDGTWMVNADIPTPERVGLPLHLLAANGEITESFGSDVPHRVPGVPYQMMRLITPSSGDCVWSTPRTRMEFEEWCGDGNLKRRIERRADWFVPYVRRDPISRSSPPQPFVMGLWLDRGEFLWTAVVVPSEEWEDRWFSGGTTPGFVPGLFNSVVEVISITDGRLVASETVPFQVIGFLEDGRVFSYEEGGDGVPSISVFEVKLDPVSGGT